MKIMEYVVIDVEQQIQQGLCSSWSFVCFFFFFKQKTAYEIGQ